MNKTFIFSILTLIILANTVYSLPAMPILPDRFFGTVLQDGNNLTAGTQITAKVAGIEDTPYTMTQNGYYDFFVKIGDSNDLIEFYIDGNLFGTATRSNGAKVNQNLSYTSPIQDPINPPKQKSSGGGSTFLPEDEIEFSYDYDLSISADSFVSTVSGNSTETHMIITNIGNGTFNDIKISVVSDRIPSSWITIAPEIISDFKPDDKMTATIYFDTPLDSTGSYQLSIRVSGMDIEKYTESLLLIKDPEVTYAKNIEIISIDSETPIAPGTTSKVKVTLKNIGLNIEYALLELTDIDDWIVIPESEYIVLDPEMEKTMIFEVTVPKDAKADIRTIMASVIGLSDAKKETTIEILNSTEENVVPIAPTGFSITNVSNTTSIVLLLSVLSLFYIYFRKRNRQ